jgi:hypothetical protein
MQRGIEFTAETQRAQRNTIWNSREIERSGEKGEGKVKRKDKAIITPNS